jgi:hypothetical protein
MRKLSHLFRAVLVSASILFLVGSASGQTPAPTPIAPNAECPQESAPDPCGLLSDLHWAMNNLAGPPPHPNWEARLDWTYNRWRNGSSENWGPIAHTIALWKPVAGKTVTDSVNWWSTFFDCQMGGVCSVAGVPDVKHLKYFKGSELLSNTYDASVNTAVAAVNFWATTHNRPALADKARGYLRATWAAYTLAAGQGPASTFKDDYPSPATAHPCQVNQLNQYFFTGPYIAAAGMRSTTAHVCQDGRGPLLTRALQWAVTSKRESVEQAAVANYLQTNWPGNAYLENVYALTSGERSTLKNHTAAGNAAPTLLSMLGNARTSVTYRFLGWNDPAQGQVRATVMEKNLNSNTVAVYGVKYSFNSREAHILFPWNNAVFRNGVTRGYGLLAPDVFNPTRFESSNIDPNDPLDPPGGNGYHGVRFGSFNVPTTGRLYHVVMSPFQSAYTQ